MYFCRYDYLKIANDNQAIGMYCGQRSGQSVLVIGNYAVLSFHSDSSVQKRGFELIFSRFPMGRYIRILILKKIRIFPKLEGSIVIIA